MDKEHHSSYQTTKDIAAINPSANAATLKGMPWGNSRGKNTALSQIAKVPIKVTISASPNSCVFTMSKVINSLNWNVWFALISSNSTFLLLFFLIPIYPGSSFTSLEQSLRAIWEVVFSACLSSQYVHQIKDNSQLLGCYFLSWHDCYFKLMRLECFVTQHYGSTK